MTEIKFEKALEKLEEIVIALERGDLSLETSMAKYEEGINLARICQTRLESAQKKVEILIKSKDGSIKREAFDDEEPGAKNSQRAENYYSDDTGTKKGKKKQHKEDLF